MAFRSSHSAKASSASPGKDPINILDTSPNKHNRYKGYSLEGGDIIDTSPIRVLPSTSNSTLTNTIDNRKKKLELISTKSNVSSRISSISVSQQQPPPQARQARQALSMQEKDGSTTTQQKHRYRDDDEQEDDEDTRGDDVLDISPEKALIPPSLEVVRDSPRTMKVPLKREEPALAPIRRGTPVPKKKKYFELQTKKVVDIETDSEFESDSEPAETKSGPVPQPQTAHKITAPERENISAGSSLSMTRSPFEKIRLADEKTKTPPTETYKYPNSDIFSTILSKAKSSPLSVKRSVRDISDDDELEVKADDDENRSSAKKRRVVTPSVDATQSILKATNILNMKAREQLLAQRRAAVDKEEAKLKEKGKDTTGKILFQPGDDDDEEEEEEEEESGSTKKKEDSSDSVVLTRGTTTTTGTTGTGTSGATEVRPVEAKTKTAEKPPPFSTWTAYQWNKLLNFVRTYQVTKNDKMLSRQEIQRRFGCDIDEFKLRVSKLNELKEWRLRAKGQRKAY